MKEFAQKGFKNASTDVIVKEAEISKGALFHYFSNKKVLYLYLYDYSIDILMNKIVSKFNYNEKDFFERLRQGSMLKIETLKMHPEIYNFMVAAYMEDSGEVKGELEQRNKGALANSQRFLFEGIDLSMFKEEIDVKKAIDVIVWTIEGFISRELKRMEKNSVFSESNYTEMLKEMDNYFDMLKQCFYK